MTGQLISVKTYNHASLRALVLGALMLSACAGAGTGTVRTNAAATGVDSESRPEVINDEVLEMEKKYYVAGVIDTYNSLASEPARMVVVGSGDAVANNLDLVMNAVDWLAEDPALIDIAPTALRLFGIEPPTYMDGRPLEGLA